MGLNSGPSRRFIPCPMVARVIPTTGKNRIMIYGAKDDGEGEVLAIFDP